MSNIKERRKDVLTSVMKDGIYEAAVTVLMEHGVDGLTMDRVAEAAGIAKGSVYKYFRSKQVLTEFIHEKTIEPAKIATQEMLDSPGLAPEKLQRLLRMWFRMFAANRGIFDFLFNDAPTRAALEPSERNTRGEAIADLTKIFEQGIAEGSFRPLDAARTAEIFLGAVVMTFERQIDRDEVRPVDESVDSLMDVFGKGLEPRDERQSETREGEALVEP